MPKMKLEFEGMEEVISRIKKLEGNVKATTEKALIESGREVRKNVGAAMNKHNQTFQTVRSLKSDAQVEWAGTIASLPVGFDIEHGGLASIFLMYGTPRMDKDQDLYNAFYGSATRNKVHKIQEDIFYNELRRLE